MKTALLGCKGTTLDLLNDIVSQASVDLACVITLPESIATRNAVAFYRGAELTSYCQRHDIPIHRVRSYNLMHAEDVRYFDEARIELLLVLGWERLIPNEILGTLGKFACGMHGSPHGLPKGRGRSPLNWSLINGHSRFVTYLFRYNQAVDAGDVIGFKVFDINQFDTIASLHAKNRIAMHQLLRLYLPLIEADTVQMWHQPPDQPTYYPKRTPEDGAIDWNQSTDEIYNLVRALSPPYPPAFCLHAETKVFVTEAYPFDPILFDNHIEPGTVVDVSVALDQFVVKTGDGSLLVSKHEPSRTIDLKVGDRMEGIGYSSTLRQIVSRYPAGVSEAEKEIQ
jgi:methionyl-tRNA formyltransferase